MYLIQKTLTSKQRWLNRPFVSQKLQIPAHPCSLTPVNPIFPPYISTHLCLSACCSALCCPSRSSSLCLRESISRPPAILCASVVRSRSDAVCSSLEVLSSCSSSSSWLQACGQAAGRRCLGMDGGQTLSCIGSQ